MMKALLVRSEGEPQRKLHLARVGRGIENLAGGPIPGARSSRKYSGDHVAEVGMIQDVEQFRAELQVGPLGNIELFFHAEIQVEQARANERILAEIAEGSRCRQHKRAGI